MDERSKTLVLRWLVFRWSWKVAAHLIDPSRIDNAACRLPSSDCSNNAAVNAKKRREIVLTYYFHRKSFILRPLHTPTQRQWIMKVSRKWLLHSTLFLFSFSFSCPVYFSIWETEEGNLGKLNEFFFLIWTFLSLDKYTVEKCNEEMKSGGKLHKIGDGGGIGVESLHILV